MLRGERFKRAVDGDDQWRGINSQNSHDVLVRSTSHTRGKDVGGVS